MNGNTTVALIARAISGEDAFGNDIYAEIVSACRGVFAPGSSSELIQGQDTVIDKPTVYLPTGTDVSAVDAVIPQAVTDSTGALILDGTGKPQGVRYNVDGSPDAWPPSPFSGWVADFSVVVVLEKVTG